MENKKKDCGAFWLKTAKSGKKFMSGKIELAGVVYPVVMFKNKYKEDGDNKPDYKVYLSEPLEPKEEAKVNIDDISDDDIPF